MKHLQNNGLELKFDRLANFRDVGGRSGYDGERMGLGLVFRSEELSKLSKEDINKIKRVGIKTICDFRTDAERKSKVSRLNEKHGIKVIALSMNDKSREFTRTEFFRFLVMGTKDINFEDIMHDMYKYMAFQCNQELKQMIELLAHRENYPILIHCTGGKDRTGFMSAMLQLAIGINYEEVMADYLHSNNLIGPKMKKLENVLRWISLFRVSSARLRPVLEVRREYLQPVYEAIIQEYGTIENYLQTACGISTQTLKSMRALLLASDDKIIKEEPYARIVLR
ncbi:tyrosine-protein phosphatase [Niallia taxi]|uniref:tyrosine-protein phosphatase n=1 Tax=Niallia taxi TaxID=2499688 RepID=UPI002E1DDE38|nr:tyrosine-protein phosphatase [Niallia taxi]